MTYFSMFSTIKSTEKLKFIIRNHDIGKKNRVNYLLSEIDDNKLSKSRIEHDITIQQKSLRNFHEHIKIRPNVAMCRYKGK